MIDDDQVKLEYHLNQNALLRVVLSKFVDSIAKNTPLTIESVMGMKPIIAGFPLTPELVSNIVIDPTSPTDDIPLARSYGVPPII